MNMTKAPSAHISCRSDCDYEDSVSRFHKGNVSHFTLSVIIEHISSKFLALLFRFKDTENALHCASPGILSVSEICAKI